MDDYKIDKLMTIFIDKLKQRDIILDSQVVDLVKLRKINLDLERFSNVDFLTRYEL